MKGDEEKHFNLCKNTKKNELFIYAAPFSPASSLNPVFRRKKEKKSYLK